MNLAELATKITVFLAPFLPFLVAGGESVAKKLGERFGQTTFDKAKSVWEKITKNSSDSAIKNTATAVKDNPESKPFRLALAASIAEYLQNNPGEAPQLAKLIAESKGIQSILVEYDGEVGDILQELSGFGIQDIVVKGKAGNISQKQ